MSLFRRLQRAYNALIEEFSDTPQNSLVLHEPLVCLVLRSPFGPISPYMQQSPYFGLVTHRSRADIAAHFHQGSASIH
jgi:hypothetical protein